MSVRRARLFRHDDGNVVLVPLDHSITSGPIASSGGVDRLLGLLADGGADGVVLHKGRARTVDQRWFRRLALVVHLNASTVHAEDPDAKYLVASVEEAIELGADAVSVHVNLGSPQESRQVSDLAAVAGACRRWNVPLLAMMYPRGPRIENPHDPRLVAHAVAVAVDLGADLVKTLYTGSVDTMARVVAGSPVPVVVAGGHVASPRAVVSLARDAMLAGASGVAVGRNVFEADEPGEMVRCLVQAVHAGVPPPLVGAGMEHEPSPR
jgi:2-amino-4,5-dihydroxy-6-oxo-7-(phosphonooxy)heptanoate synthase